jgi:predicted nucleic acid-binding protein
MNRFLLDAGPLSRISHPRTSPDIKPWLINKFRQGVELIISEVADYEVRRELLRAGKKVGLRRLDELKQYLDYAPITTEMMLLAAQFWADARKLGRPTADPASLDSDVIIAAQAKILDVSVVTDNVKHLALFVDAIYWHDI